MPSKEEMIVLFSQFLSNYNYKAARSLLEDRKQPLWLALTHLIDMQQSRLAFDFKDAYAYWTEAKKQLSTDLSLDPSFLHAETLFAALTDTRDTAKHELALIVELFRQLEIYLEVEDTVSFLIRFYRAREAVLSYIAKHYGIERTRTGSIHELFKRLEVSFENEQATNYIGAYLFWKSKNVSDTMNIRNRSFIGHGRQGFSEAKVWEEYSGYAMQTVAVSKRRFIRDGSLMLRDLGVQRDDWFPQMNAFILKVAAQAFEANRALATTVQLVKGKSQMTAICRELVLSGNYRSVKELYKPALQSDLWRLLTLAENLHNCNVMAFRADMKVVMRVLEQFRSDPHELAFCQQMLVLEEKEQRAFIYYLYSLAQLFDEREAMVDFIVVFFRLVEELLLFAIGWDVDGQQKLRESRYRRPIMLNEGERIATFAVFKRVLQGYVQRAIKQGRTSDLEMALCAELYDLIQSVEVANVLELRHEGVSGHGFADLSRDHVLEISGGVEPLERIRPLMEKFELVPSYSIFRLVDEAILLLLSESEQGVVR
ncbi:MAG: hypothetical protein RLZZ267_990 [Bacillota bacterium]